MYLIKQNFRKQAKKDKDKCKEEQPVFPDSFFIVLKHCWVCGEVLFVPCAQLSVTH